MWLRVLLEEYKFGCRGLCDEISYKAQPKRILWLYGFRGCLLFFSILLLAMPQEIYAFNFSDNEKTFIGFNILEQCHIDHVVADALEGEISDEVLELIINACLEISDENIRRIIYDFMHSNVSIMIASSRRNEIADIVERLHEECVTTCGTGGVRNVNTDVTENIGGNGQFGPAGVGGPGSGSRRVTSGCSCYQPPAASNNTTDTSNN